MTPEGALEQGEKVEQARQIILELKFQQRRVFLLKYVEGYSYQEIERMTGYSNDQVRSYLQNAGRNFKLKWNRG